MCGSSSSDRVHRHDKIRDLLCQDFSRSGTQAIKEAQHLLLGSQQKPADIYVNLWTGASPAAFDVNAEPKVRV